MVSMLVCFWIVASVCVLLSAVIVVGVRVPQALEDLVLYGKVRTAKRKWSAVQLIEVPKRCVIDQLIQ